MWQLDRFSKAFRQPVYAVAFLVPPHSESSNISLQFSRQVAT